MPAAERERTELNTTKAQARTVKDTVTAIPSVPTILRVRRTEEEATLVNEVALYLFIVLTVCRVMLAAVSEERWACTKTGCSNMDKTLRRVGDVERQLLRNLDPKTAGVRDRRAAASLCFEEAMPVYVVAHWEEVCLRGDRNMVLEQIEKF
uniref:Uncharacterized protein n=1 Tax=Pristionchus pacificus TaxID=54126 RepID=A0A2A6D1N6_PRIPA|eukprot:PDM84354.1 hypothetical protein PRIPAC_33377 [Pristionchus pacificus]